MPPSLTALLITHQQRLFVDQAIQSILRQDDQPDEIVLVDDGSTDGTQSHAVKMLGERVRIVALPHRGIGALAETYNAGLRECHSDLVSILEGDDRWRATKIATHRRSLEDEHVVLAHGPYAVIGARGTVLRARVDPAVRLPRGRYDAFPHHLVASYVMGVTVTFRRSALERIGGFTQLPHTPHIDYATYLALSREGLFHNDDEVHAEWRKHGKSGTTALAGVDLEGARLCRELALTARRSASSPGLPGEASIVARWEDAQGRQIWGAARLLLRARRFRDARALISTANWRGYPPGLVTRLALAWVAAALRLDLEWLVRLTRGRSVLEEFE